MQLGPLDAWRDVDSGGPTSVGKDWGRRYYGVKVWKWGGELAFGYRLYRARIGRN